VTDQDLVGHAEEEAVVDHPGQRLEGGGEGRPALAAALKALPGVVDHGLFFGMADEVLVGHPDGSVEGRTRSA
jgi:ribose 5-phosphate isomerase